MFSNITWFYDESLKEWQLDLLRELFLQVIPDVPTAARLVYEPPTASDKDVAEYFRLRFEKAEQRYDRMKGVTRAALEKVRCIERENRDLRTSKELVGLKLKPLYCDTLLSKFVNCASTTTTTTDEVLKTGIEYMVSELSRMSAENESLMENNKQLRDKRGCIDLREDPALEALYAKAISEAENYKPLIAKLQSQITAMEYEWTQAKDMRDELFDYDDKLREHEMVADVLILKRQPSPSDGVKIFATSRRHMIEILVDDRNRNINGHYARWVIPVEKLRAKKDAEILHLRMTIRRYEIMFGITSAETHFIADLSTLDQELITVNSRLNSLRQACEDADERVLFLNKSVKNYEDHANEWKMAHSNAVDVVNKAEKLRADYAGMMDSLHKEGQCVAAKKKELEKSVSTMLNMEGRFARLRDISKEVDEAEGEIAAKDAALKRLKESIVLKDNAFSKEKEALSQLEVEIAKTKLAIQDAQQQQQQQQNPPPSDHVMVDEALSAGLSHVFV